VSVPGARPDAARTQAQPTARHKVTIVTTPAGAEILLGDKLLGRSPDPVELDHATADVALTLRLAGHKTREIRIRPDQDRRQEVSLETQPEKGKPKVGTVKGKKPEPKKPEPKKPEPKKPEPKKPEPKKPDWQKPEPKKPEPKKPDWQKPEDLIDPFKK